MEPVLAGPHFISECQFCGEKFRISAEHLNLELPCRCLSCGATSKTATRRFPGDILRLRKDLDTNPPKRFDIVAFEREGQAMVKRIWALPGEHVAIQSGEVLINGVLLEKTLTQFRQVAIPVLGRWEQEDTGARWSAHYPQNNFVGGDSQQSLTATAITDDYSCNQGLSYQTQRVDDYAALFTLTGRLSEQEMQSSLRLDIQCKGRKLPILFRSAFRKLHIGEGQEPYWEGGLLIIPNLSQILVVVCDERLLVSESWRHAPIYSEALASIENRLEAWPYAECLVHTSPNNLEDLLEVRIWRDLYLRTDTRTGAGTQEFDGADGYFVMGDNQPSSVDSRNGLGRVAEESLLGVAELPSMKD